MSIRKITKEKPMNFGHTMRHTNNYVLDHEVGELFPWYVPEMLEKSLSKLPFEDWTVFEWGGGASTVWYCLKAKHVDTLETSEEWAKNVSDYITNNLQRDNFSMKAIDVQTETAPFGSQTQPTPNMEKYLNYIKTLNKKYDCIAIDGSYRDDAIEVSLECIKEGGYLIFDNFQQNSSGYTKLKNKHLLDKYEGTVYTFKNEWHTGIWRIENE
jgi:hypothetical protein